MRRGLATVLCTAIAVLGPASTALAEPPEPPEPYRPVEVTSMWPVCTIVLGVGICIPP